MNPIDEPAAVGQGLSQIPRDIVATVLDLAVTGWAAVLAAGLVNQQSSEADIAGFLGTEMRAEQDRRPELRGRMRIEEEVGTRSPGATKANGRIDVKVIYSLAYGEYFGLECKRVGAKGLARKYLTEGVLRFVSAKYSHGHDFGAMLAFDVSSRYGAGLRYVRDYLAKHADDACIEQPWIAEVSFGIASDLYRTRHRQVGGTPITLLHLFLGVPQSHYSAPAPLHSSVSI